MRKWQYKKNGMIFELFFFADAKEKADKVLEEWDDICKEANIEHFLVLGTCLGFVRDKGYLKNEHDHDVGVKSKDFPILCLKLVGSGFIAVDHFGTGIHFCKGGIWLDVLFNLDHGRTEKFLMSFDKVTYNGRVYNVPHPVEEYLQSVYGKDWRIPK